MRFPWNGSGLYEAIKLIIEDQDSVSIASSYNFAFTILNNLISQGITLAEILDLAIRDMEDELVNIREATVSAMSIEKVNRKKYEEAEAEVKKWQDRTILAMEKGNDHLALEALKRKKFFATKVKNLEITLQQQTILSNCLKLSLFALSNKVAEAKYFQENIDFTNIKKRAIPQIAITELEDIDSDLESLKRQLDQL
jgi:phage shock protein A